MALIKGGFLRIVQTILYLINFCAAGIVLGIYSYFLSVLADRNIRIPTYEKAVEGISGAAVVYTIFAVVLTCCLGGVSFFAFLGLFLDVCFIGGFIAIAIMTRHGASSCKGNVKTPLGNGQATSHSSGFGNNGFGVHHGSNLTYDVSLKTACNLNTAVFAVSLLAALFFLITALMQIALVKSHKKEKRFGPGPSNGYTSGTSKPKFWQKKPKNHVERDTELGTGAAVGTGGLGVAGADTRPSHETGYTGSTVGGPNNASYDKVDGTHAHGHAPHGSHGGYYTQPTGTGSVNPYGYENQPTYTTGTATNY